MRISVILSGLEGKPMENLGIITTRPPEKVFDTP